MIQYQELKRLNYFTGLFTTADDWKDEQQYHRRHLQIHNAQMHRPGILPDVDELLLVRQTDPPSMSAEVRPGAAIDPSGAYLYLPQAHTLVFDANDIPDGGTRYIVMRSAEVASEPVYNVENPNYSGYTRLVDAVEIAVIANLDPESDVELARIAWDPDATIVTDAADPLAPGQNQIDLRYVQWAGPGSLELSIWRGQLVDDGSNMLDRTREAYGKVADKFHVRTAEDVRQAALMLVLLADLRQLGPTQLTAVFNRLGVLEQEAGEEIQGKFGEIGDALAAYQAAVEALLAPLGVGEWLHDLFPRQEAVLQAAEVLAEVELAEPVAKAAASLYGSPPVLTLNGEASEAFEGRFVKKYEWDSVTSVTDPPVARIDVHSGEPPQPGETTSVRLDASPTVVAPERFIDEYQWEYLP